MKKMKLFFPSQTVWMAVCISILLLLSGCNAPAKPDNNNQIEESSAEKQELLLSANKKLAFEPVEIHRIGNINANTPYRVQFKWVGADASARYKVTFRTETATPSATESAFLRDKLDNSAVVIDSNRLANYDLTQIVVEDRARDFGGRSERPLDRRFKKYIITIEYADKARYGNESITYEIEKFYIPNAPHSEGDVIKPPFGGR
jgi:hypothetical protein